MTPLRILLNARKRLETPEKWHQGTLAPRLAYDTQGRGECPVCMLGALNHASSGDPLAPRYDVASDKAFRALSNALPKGAKHIPVFNDDPTTTHRKVLNVFDRAIEALRR